MIQKFKIKIMDNIRKNEKCYFCVKLLKQLKNKDFRDYIIAFQSSDIVWVRHFCTGGGYSEKLVYKISVGEGSVGFFAVMRHIITSLSYAEFYHLTPVVEWKKGCYAEEHFVNGTDNVFEYYFLPVSEVGCEEVMGCENVVFDCGQRIGFKSEEGEDGYRVQNRFADQFGRLYHKYIRLNNMTKDYIDRNLKKLLGSKKTLGVHVRGTDYKQAYNEHPVRIEERDFLKPAKELFEKYGYKQIFLATDSLKAVELFEKEFGKNLVYYKDVQRSDGDRGIHCLECERENHHYMLGLEILRDVYTLADCDSLLAGFSQVSFAAQYIKIANGGTYREVFLIDHGVHHNSRRTSRLLDKK